MRRPLLLIICLFISVMAMSQRAIKPQQPELRQGMQRWRELNLSTEQKRRIILLIQQQRQQRLLNQKSLNEILTEEQKKKLLKWREEKLVDTTKH